MMRKVLKGTTPPMENSFSRSLSSILFELQVLQPRTKKFTFKAPCLQTLPVVVGATLVSFPILLYTTPFAAVNVFVIDAVPTVSAYDFKPAGRTEWSLKRCGIGGK
jgi:hypothetical protein